MPKTAENASPDAAVPLRPPFADVDDGAAPLAVLEAETSATLEELRAEARRAAEEARAAATERAYATDWRDFSHFCRRIGHDRLPASPETITLYLADLMHRGLAAPPGSAGSRRSLSITAPRASRRRPSTRSCAASIADSEDAWASRKARRPR